MIAVRRSLSRSWQDYSFLWVVFSRQWTSYFFNIDWPRSAQDSWILYISGFSDRENLERKIMFHFSPLAATNKMWHYKYCWPPSHIKCTSTNTRDVFTKISFWPTKAKKVLWSPQILGPLAGRFWVFVVWFFFTLCLYWVQAWHYLTMFSYIRKFRAVHSCKFPDMKGFDD